MEYKAQPMTTGPFVFFLGTNASGRSGLWETDGTATGTTELQAQEVWGTGGLFGSPDPGSGLFPGFTVFDSSVFFPGTDANGRTDIWQTDGTGPGTQEVVSGSYQYGLSPRDLTVFNSEMHFAGLNASRKRGLWETDGTAAGTIEVAVQGVSTNGLLHTTFGGATGTLKLGSSSNFTGTISDFAAADTNGLLDVSFGAHSTPGYAENSNNTLTISDGAHTASLALLAQYMASSFVTTSAAHYGMLITDPLSPPPDQLALPHA